MRTCIALALICAATPLAAQGADTTLFTPRSELRIGATAGFLKRVVSNTSGGLSQASATLRGLEFFGLFADGGGLRLRYEMGTLPGGPTPLAAGKFESLDARAVLGTHSFAFVPGYLMRGTTWEGEVRRFGLVQAGAELGRAFTGAGLQVKAAGTYMRTVQEAKSDSVGVSGIEGRTSVLYAPPKWPVFVEMGYRREVLAYKRDGAIDRREENSIVTLSIGLQAGIPGR